jgi:hypothetical protein
LLDPSIEADKRQRASVSDVIGGLYVRKSVSTHLFGFFVGSPNLVAHKVPLEVATNLKRT